jgi:hypothetical protein
MLLPLKLVPKKRKKGMALKLGLLDWFLQRGTFLVKNIP